MNSNDIEVAKQITLDANEVRCYEADNGNESFRIYYILSVFLWFCYRIDLEIKETVPNDNL